MMVVPSTYAHIQVEFGGRPRSLVDLIDGWANSVLRFHFDIVEDRTIEDGAWHLDDLVGSYHIRDAVEEAVQRELGSDVRLPILKAGDELFLTFAAENPYDVARLVSRNPGPHDDNWWWYYLPFKGPIARLISEGPSVQLAE